MQPGSDMHFDKSSKEKPCCTLPTVKELLKEKRRREISAGPSAASSASPNSVPSHAVPHLSSCNPFSDTGGSYSDMAASYKCWTQPSESVLSHYSGQAGPGYSTSYNTPMTPAYNKQQHASAFGEGMSHTYEYPGSCVVNPSWSVVGQSQVKLPSFGSSMDARKLEDARMMLNGMDYSSTISQDEDGDTILHIYTAKGLRECAFAAAERLRDVDRLNAKEHKGKTALLVAVTANQPEIVRDLLLLGADINAWDVNGQTALHLAAHYGFLNVLQALLYSRPDVNLVARNFEGMTPLHCAAISHTATIKSLSNAGLPDVDLHAKASEKLSCLQMLVSAGASLLSQEIKSNKTVLHLAVKEGNIQLVRYLLAIPQPNMKDFVNMKAHGHTALHMAAGLHGNPNQEEIMHLLLSKGADPRIRNLENDQPAHLLQSGPQGEQIKTMLKKHGASSRRRIASSQDMD